MGKIEKNILGSGYVIYAEDRANRPHITADGVGECPFCVENRRMLSGISYETPRVLVCANKYPALAAADGDFGIHEVVVDTFDHHTRTFELPTEQIAETLDALKARFTVLSAIESIRDVKIFKNDGWQSGMSIAHSHWQILAVPYAADVAATDPFVGFSATNIVFENAEFVVFCPISSCFSYEMWLAPKRKAAHCADLDGAQTFCLAEALKVALTALARTVEDLSYNLMFYNAGGADSGFFVRVAARNFGLGGFELSGGGFINPVSPRKAAETLRKMLEISQN